MRAALAFNGLNSVIFINQTTFGFPKNSVNIMCSPRLIFNMVLSHRFVKTSFFLTSPVIVLQIPHIEYISASDSSHVQKMSEFSFSVLHTGQTVVA